MKKNPSFWLSLIVILAVGGTFIYLILITTQKIVKQAAALPQNATSTAEDTNPCSQVDVPGPSYNIHVKDGLPNYTIQAYVSHKNNSTSTDCYQVINNSNSTRYLLESGEDDSGNPVYESATDSSDDGAVQAGDFNFDGYKDIMITVSTGATGNTDNDFFLYNPSTKKFEFDQALTGADITGLDQNGNLYYFSNWCAGCGITQTYKYVNGKLTMTKSVSDDVNRTTGKWTETIVDYSDGKYSTTTKSIDPQY